jgi:nitrogen fixation protein FixH
MLLFGGYILYMVFQAMQTDVDLVRKDYYEQTLTYQDQIDNVERTNALAAPITIAANHPGQFVTVQFPEDFAGKTVSGNIQLFRPSDKDLDVELPLRLDANQRQLINTSQLQKGLWRVKVHSQAEGQDYFVEEDVMLQ